MKVIGRVLGPLWRGWDRFWFAPTSPAPVCLFRIFFAALALLQGLMMLPDVLTWYGHDGVLSIETARALQNGPNLSVLLWFDPPDPVVVALLVVQLLACLTLLVGYRTRTSAVLVYLIIQAFAIRNPMMYRGVDALLRVYGFLLLFAPAGAMWSLDAYLKNRGPLKGGPPLRAPWVQRLMQIQVAMAYWQSFWGKVGGQTWQNGTAIYYVAHAPDYLRHAVPPLLDRLWLYQAFSWFSLAIELAMFSLVWIKALRYWVLLTAIGFHLSIHWFMNVDVCELAIIATYVSFVDPADLDRASRWARSWWIRLSSGVGSRWRP